MAYVINYEEVNGMPRRDGTGPMGSGPMTGRGLGLGLACRRGFGGGFRRGLATSQNSIKTHKELLQEQKELLQSQLEAIDNQLVSL